jgi:hypothetical protein
MKLAIIYLTSNSRHYTFPNFVNLLKKSLKKDIWTLLVLTHSNDCEYYNNELNNSSIDYKVFNVMPHNNYMIKVRLAVQYAEDNNIPYLMKCDNDIYIGANTLDYIIDNLSILDNKKHLTIGPVLSSGIPTVEYFMEQFLSDDERYKLNEYFLSSHFYNRDGVVYTHLNKHTMGSKVWNKNNFFNDVKHIDNDYKGVHPIRINYEAIDYLNICILNNKDKFFKSQPTSLILNDSSPYLCDSVFCILTDTYKKIINDSTLFVDDYDEVPLNKYAWKESMNHVFVENGFAIHMLYNWYDNLSEYEINFTNCLFT